MRLCIFVSILNQVVFSGDNSFSPAALILPVILALAPITINIIQRKWIFNIGAIGVAWMYIAILLFFSRMFMTYSR